METDALAFQIRPQAPSSTLREARSSIESARRRTFSLQSRLIEKAEADAPTGGRRIDRHERVALLKTLLSSRPIMRLNRQRHRRLFERAPERRLWIRQHEEPASRPRR
jgi:hypothetical protein